MAALGYQPPDLASVLKTLSQFAPAQSPAPPATEVATGIATFQTALLDPAAEEAEYEPAYAVIPDAHKPVQNGGLLQPTPANNSSQVANNSHCVSADRTVAVDPATIIDWPSGLRCVMRTVARHDAIIARIKKMIEVQHDHERQWWAGRETLLKKQEGRLEGRKKLADVLRSVGGKVPINSSSTDTEDDVNELMLYDRKVYRASVEMLKAMHAELQEMGVPFFGTKAHLVDKGDGGESKPGQGKAIDKQQMFGLQKKMLDLLEDLCAG